MLVVIIHVKLWAEAVIPYLWWQNKFTVESQSTVLLLNKIMAADSSA